MKRVSLPEPSLDGECSLERSLRERRSIRSYAREPLTIADVSQLLWAAQGVTGTQGERTAPSAGALYPLEIYVAVGDVADLEKGIYKYRPRPHDLIHLASEDRRADLSAAALGQEWIGTAPVVMILTAVHDRMTGKYGRRGIQYSHMEVGHAAQNICLQSAARGLGTTVVGAFIDGTVRKVLELPAEEQPLGLMPVGRVSRR
jgi:SagB-type dehydrogenase family enzyme